jgi:hypothetical protein
MTLAQENGSVMFVIKSGEHYASFISGGRIVWQSGAAGLDLATKFKTREEAQRVASRTDGFTAKPIVVSSDGG